jgi:long-chain acyl-CoA synthetase
LFSFTTLSELFDHIQSSLHLTNYLNYREKGKWKQISTEDFSITVQALAAAFQKRGVRKGTTVGIVSDSSPFWLMVDFALQRLGAVSVPIFANIASENLIYEIEDAQIQYLYVAAEDKCAAMERYLDTMKLVLVRDVDYCAENAVMWDDFIEPGKSAEAADVAPGDLATIIYTSGSTGRPKGVELTHENLVTQLNDTAAFFTLQSDDRILTLLPLAHVFERMVMMFYLAHGVPIYFVDDVKKVGEIIRKVKPSVMTVVPRVLEKIYNKTHDKIGDSGFLARVIGTLALHRAEHKHPQHGTRSMLNRLFDKLVYARLRKALGGNLRLVICGGAPLSLSLCRFFTNIGVPLYQGYGLTETSPVISVNTPEHNRCGTCGRVYDHVQVKISPQGELLVRGKSVMRGYHNNPEATAEAIDSRGWLHTGDRADLDADGYLVIKSRIKEMFKTSTGKFVSAVAIEQRLTRSRWIDYAMVVAEGRPYVTVLLFSDAKHAAEDILSTEIGKAIEETNVHLNAWEQIQKYAIVTEIPSVENGMLTPSMKIVRDKAMRRYRKEIEALYERGAA